MLSGRDCVLRAHSQQTGVDAIGRDEERGTNPCITGFSMGFETVELSVFIMFLQNVERMAKGGIRKSNTFKGVMQKGAAADPFQFIQCVGRFNDDQQAILCSESAKLPESKLNQGANVWI